jgi:hypothetical protein
VRVLSTSSALSSSAVKVTNWPRSYSRCACTES